MIFNNKSMIVQHYALANKNIDIEIYG